MDNLVVGTVLAFKYSGGKTHKERKYVFDVATLNNQSHQLEVLAIWYRFNDDNSSQPITNPSFYIKMDQYVRHIDLNEINK